MKALVRLIAVSLLLATAAYQIQRPIVLHAADGLVSHATFRGFFPAEDGLRWSSDGSTIVLPGPGAGATVRVEVLLSGWRPPGQDAPRMTLSAGGHTVTQTLGPSAAVVFLETATAGFWNSDLEVGLQSDAFEPGAGDARRLGVRVEEARLIPMGRGIRVPPLSSIAALILLGWLVAFVAMTGGVSPRTADRAAMLCIVVLAALFAFARPIAAVWAWPLIGALGVIGLLARVMPRVAVWVAAVTRSSGQALRVGLSRVKDVQVAAMVFAGVVLITLAYRAQSRIEIDLGSGHEVAVAQGFGSFEGKGGGRSRRAPRGAQLDLSDFGGGTSWKVTSSAAIDGPPRDVDVLRVGDREIVSALQETQWTEGSTSAPAPFGWTSGLILTMPGASDALRLDEVTVERDGALPSIRIVAAILIAALLALVAFGGAGLSAVAGRWACALLLIGSSTAIALNPLAAIPFTFQFLCIVGTGTALALLVRGIVSVSDNGSRVLPGDAAIAAAASGWVAWLSATAFPYYRGGHFVFHSSIAEEIWKGRFLIYYLPFPGSMLSEQAQWGKIVMPHPALWQLLMSPLSILPRPWFYLAEKVVLATLFASLVLVASVVAERVSGKRAATFTAILFVGLVPGFQMLGLGHLMTILGVWTSSLALPWLMFRVDDLTRFRTWLATSAIFTFCFLSYTAALLFTGAVMVFLILASLRANFPRARLLFTMLCMASACAFFLYYVHWTLPFLMQSVPKIIGGAGMGGKAAEATPILSRLLLEPGKLSYSYGSMLIPLAGALSLFVLLPRSWPRLVLTTWIGILFFVSGVDLFFNFLLKHHYYVMLPVAVGWGALTARIEERWGKAPSIALTVLILGVGFKTAMEVALGLIP
ncbi:MAG: hypothetical protein ABI672_03220 [Vicinamibacteria bacterium]